MNDSASVPNAPETVQQLFENSDVIAFCIIDTVENQIKKSARIGNKLDVAEIFPEQYCTVSFLWILKGDTTLQHKTVAIVKEKSRYFFSEKEKRVIYLKQEGDIFRTVDRFAGEHRLASALCDIRNLKKDETSGGIVVTVHGYDNMFPTIHVLKGRQKTSIKINDTTWNRFLLKSTCIGNFNICEIPLEKGTYTVLMELKGDLFSHTRLINDYYACVNVGEYRWWEPLYFGY